MYMWVTVMEMLSLNSIMIKIIVYQKTTYGEEGLSAYSTKSIFYDIIAIKL